jgi:hypothetical protein
VARPLLSGFTFSIAPFASFRLDGIAWALHWRHDNLEQEAAAHINPVPNVMN